jgi:hypothetical protein
LNSRRKIEPCVVGEAVGGGVDIAGGRGDDSVVDRIDAVDLPAESPTSNFLSCSGFQLVPYTRGFRNPVLERR